MLAGDLSCACPHATTCALNGGGKVLGRSKAVSQKANAEICVRPGAHLLLTHRAQAKENVQCLNDAGIFPATNTNSVRLFSPATSAVAPNRPGCGRQRNPLMEDGRQAQRNPPFACQHRLGGQVRQLVHHLAVECFYLSAGKVPSLAGPCSRQRGKDMRRNRAAACLFSAGANMRPMTTGLEADRRGPAIAAPIASLR